jgi:hypothetical protein
MKILKSYKRAKIIETDVAIVGGGLSGITVALSCARNGLRTLLIEKYGFPGGLITSAFGYPLRVFNVQKDFSELFISEDLERIEYPVFSTVIRYLLKNEAIPQKLIPDPLRISGSIIPFDFEKFKFTLLELLLDFKVEILLHSSFVKAKLSGNTVKSIFVLGKEGLIEVFAKYFVDATGNCVVFKSIDESLTRKVNADIRYNFILTGCDFSRVDERIVCEKVEMEDITYHAYVVSRDGEKFAIYELPLKNHCAVFGLSSGEFNPEDIFSISEAEKELQLKVYSLIEYLRHFKPFENARISMLPAQIYFTEGRRLNGLYSLVVDDVFNGKNFDDEIAVVKVSVVGDKIFPCLLSPDKKFDSLIFRFPLSSFLTDIKNLVVVGRNADVSDDLRFILYSFPFVMKTSENIGRIISFAFKNDLSLTDFKTQVKFGLI